MNHNSKLNPTIQTVSGNYFNFLTPDLSEFTIQDIAHALSHICRYTGHVKHFMSVAQHSVIVSHHVPPEHAMAGLLHDAAEAFIGDVSKPLKGLLPQYKVIEELVERAVLGRFKVSYPLDESVKIADNRALKTERRDLMPPGHVGDEWSWLDAYEYLPITVVPLTPVDARLVFMARYKELAKIN